MLNRIDVIWSDAEGSFIYRLYEDGDVMASEPIEGVNTLDAAIEWALWYCDRNDIKPSFFAKVREENFAIWVHEDQYDPDPVPDDGPVPFGWCG